MPESSSVDRPMTSPRWTEHDVSDPGITLIELLAYSADMLGAYQDRVAEEQRLARRWRLTAGVATAVALACLGRCGRR
jgi:hypothetical protein